MVRVVPGQAMLVTGTGVHSVWVSGTNALLDDRRMEGMIRV